MPGKHAISQDGNRLRLIARRFVFGNQLKALHGYPSLRIYKVLLYYNISSHKIKEEKQKFTIKRDGEAIRFAVSPANLHSVL
jgi:hypothetical protein